MESTSPESHGSKTEMDGTVSRPQSEDGGSTRTHLRIDGMYSATCETFLESVAENHDGVTSAEASYITETVRIDHDPSKISESELQDVLTTLGYTAYLRSNTHQESNRSESTTRKTRELHGVRKRRDESILGLRYAAGILFGAFLLVPYVAILYPAHLAPLLGGMFAHFEGAFQLDSAGGFLFLRIYLVMTGVVLFFTGMPILRGAYVGLRTRQPTTDLLVAITALGAYVYSTITVLLGQNDIYYDLAIVVVAAVMAATFYEAAVKKRALNRLTNLTVSQVDTARLSEPDGTTKVPVEELSPGDTVLVQEGERVPVNGPLREGNCLVNEAVVTGESIPIRKGGGDELVAGSIVTENAALVDVSDNSEMGIDRITTAIWDLQSADHGVRRRADRLAAYFIPLVTSAALLGGIVTLLFGGGLLAGLLTAVLALLVTSPWALGLATLLSVASSIEQALERGIVVFDETIFERLREIDVVVFDKTGTLTTGEMDVVGSDIPSEILNAVVTLERRAPHPVAHAIVEAFEPAKEDERLTADGGSSSESPEEEPLSVESFQNHGTGVSGTVAGDEVLVGNLDLFIEQGWDIDEELRRRTHEEREVGRIPVLVGRNGVAEGLIVVGDEPRDYWTETLSNLDDRGIEVIILTGDHEDATSFLKAHDAVEDVFASVSPEAKAEAVRRITADRQVAMVGDGTNDAMALAAANLGISLGSGTALAADAADIAILDDDIRSVETAFDLARAAHKRVKQNLIVAFLYNLVVLPLALAGLMNPVFAMGAVVLTAAALVANSMRDLVST
jgi:heavy metal translocating P-type ATPase